MRRATKREDRALQKHFIGKTCNHQGNEKMTTNDKPKRIRGTGRTGRGLSETRTVALYPHEWAAIGEPRSQNIRALLAGANSTKPTENKN